MLMCLHDVHQRWQVCVWSCCFIKLVEKKRGMDRDSPDLVRLTLPLHSLHWRASMITNTIWLPSSSKTLDIQIIIKVEFGLLSSLTHKFWNDCCIVVKLMAPLVRLLRLVNCDERPWRRYVYEGMYRTRLGIKTLFKHIKT